ncbi:winged helix-turn-helix transcriptional regulator [Streptomyces sp. NPDC093221]|uniref:winged helix-turn-helix transcriptional regulator n=1 Tax=Streptomyces sp. NPDC093221 TaxID=3366032 RepID=UPI0037F25ED1
MSPHESPDETRESPGAHCYERVADCRLRAATDLFAHTWDPVVLAALRTGPRRRRALRAAIGGISDKVLTETLHRLLGNGLVGRRAYAEAPPRVEYGLTALGESLVDGPMRALGRWALDHGDELLDAQEAAHTAADAAAHTATHTAAREAARGAEEW